MKRKKLLRLSRETVRRLDAGGLLRRAAGAASAEPPCIETLTSPPLAVSGACGRTEECVTVRTCQG